MGTGVRFPVGSQRLGARAKPRIVSPVVPDSAIKIALSANISSGGEDTTSYGMTAVRAAVASIWNSKRRT